ncbi:MAG: hypothetical protein GXY15_14305 [Candidatus Hydrogenedentes bacterium]|nr:hypothetical protein [Candidatus Hydrogenedentota bacterium]
MGGAVCLGAPAVGSGRAGARAAGAGDRLVTRLWDVPHQFSIEMQDEAFAWLEKQLAGE